MHAFPRRKPKNSIMSSTSSDHARASRRRSCTRSCTSTTFASRNRAPRCFRICGFALPLIDQTSHALIRPLRRWPLHFIARCRRNRGERALRDRIHRRVESAAAATTTTTTCSVELYRRATPAIRCRRFPLHCEARKANWRGVFWPRPTIRSTDARRQLLRRIRRQPR